MRKRFVRIRKRSNCKAARRMRTCGFRTLFGNALACSLQQTRACAIPGNKLEYSLMARLSLTPGSSRHSPLSELELRLRSKSNTVESAQHAEELRPPLPPDLA